MRTGRALYRLLYCVHDPGDVQAKNANQSENRLRKRSLAVSHQPDQVDLRCSVRQVTGALLSCTGLRTTPKKNESCRSVMPTNADYGPLSV